jgi:glycosyltransferase involved in cell wall biosynthesis
MADKEPVARPWEVTFFQRYQIDGLHFSIESVSQRVQEHLPEEFAGRLLRSRFTSKGIWRRVYNIIEAACRQSVINHITGDVHYLALLLKGRRTVLTIHDCHLLHLKKGWSQWIFKLLWYDLPVRKVGYVVAISEETKKELLRFTNCAPEKITVIYDTISPLFQPHSKPFNKVKPVLLHIGVAPNKNLERLAEALEGVSCHLLIVGRVSVAQQAKLERHNIEYSCFYNLPEAEVLRKYQECDIVTFVSTYEGFGMPIVEGNAVGRAVLTSNVSSMPEVAGEGACLVNPCDVNSIRTGLLKLINDDEYRESLIAKGFINRQRFTAHELTKYYQLYRKIREQS